MRVPSVSSINLATAAYLKNSRIPSERAKVILSDRPACPAKAVEVEISDEARLLCGQLYLQLRNGEKP